MRYLGKNIQKIFFENFFIPNTYLFIMFRDRRFLKSDTRNSLDKTIFHHLNLSHLEMLDLGKSAFTTKEVHLVNAQRLKSLSSHPASAAIRGNCQYLPAYNKHVCLP